MKCCPTPRRGHRHPDTCNSCGKPYKNTDPLPQQKVDEFFDQFREALEAAGKIAKPDPMGQTDPVFDWFRARCVQRLKQGAETYGNSNFLRPEVDLINEALEEQMDTANYALMELVKHGPDDTDRACLGEAVAFSFYATQSLLRYKDKRRGMSG